MSFNSPFVSESYSADRNIFKLAVEQQAIYLSKVLEQDKEQIKNNLFQYYIKNKEKFSSIKATILMKDKNEDRQLKIVELSKLLRYAEKKNYHLSPSLVGYTNSDEEVCVNAIGTKLFIANRSFYKKLRQKAIDEGNDELEDKYNKLQNAFKIFNNAQSGAMSSEGTPITNPSGHTSLTSTTRCITSTANLINEQFITGNRIYNNPSNTLQAITARIQVTDLKALNDVMVKYNLHYPTSDEVMKMVRHCSSRYWSSVKHFNTIKEYLDKLSKLELASILYTLDFASLYQYNEEFCRSFLDDWTAVDLNPENSLKPDNSDRYTLCVSKLPRKSSSEIINQLNYNHVLVEKKYSDIISVLFKSIIPPTALYDVSSAVRECVLTSDTDSCIFTMDHVADNYCKNDRIKTVRLIGVLTYFIRLISIDQHGQLSTNINVSKENLRILQMKNEFYYSGYVTTLMSKHYYAIKKMVEGVLLDKLDMETKGVHLRGNKIAKKILDFSYQLRLKILEATETNELLDAAEMLKEVADCEREIIENINNCKWDWLRREGVKGKSSYKNPLSQPYLYHLMWEDVFSAKYGHAPDLPYVGYKINMSLDSPKKTREFIATIPDLVIRQRFEKFCTEHDKWEYSNLIIPAERISANNGFPSEIKEGIDTRTIIKQNLKPVYTVLESVGLHFINKSTTRLISDEH